jgi:hypothetical protein
VGVPDHVLARVLRVWSESLLRMARTETEVYHGYHEQLLLRSGMAQRDIMEHVELALDEAGFTADWNGRRRCASWTSLATSG